MTKSQRTVFVSQLTRKTESYDLRKYFKRKAGRVASIHFLTDRRSGLHKGCAYVEFERLSDVPYAVRCDGKVPSFQRFPIKVMPSESEANLADGESQGKWRVYVGHLSKDISDRELKGIFSEIGKVSHVQISKENTAR